MCVRMLNVGEKKRLLWTHELTDVLYRYWWSSGQDSHLYGDMERETSGTDEEGNEDVRDLLNGNSEGGGWLDKGTD